MKPDNAEVEASKPEVEASKTSGTVDDSPALEVDDLKSELKRGSGPDKSIDAPKVDVTANTEATQDDQQDESLKKDAKPASKPENKSGTSEKKAGFKKGAKNDSKKNYKFDASQAPKEDGPAAIRKQVEFYFSDSNLPVDKFMWTSTGGSENKPMPLKTISTFSRMRRFEPYSKIVEALKESKFLVIEGETDSETVKRREAYNPVKKDRLADRSVYVKGFGDETPTTQFDLEAFFTKFGTINSVRLRRDAEKLFKGSVFVEFTSPAVQQQFLEDAKDLTWEGKELTVLSKQAYVDMKCEQIRNGEIEPSNKTVFFEGKEKYNKDKASRGGRGGSRGGHGDRGGRRGRGGRGGGGRGGRGGGRGGQRGSGNREANVDVAAAAIEAEKNEEASKKGTKRKHEGGEVAEAGEPVAKKGVNASPQKTAQPDAA